MIPIIVCLTKLISNTTNGAETIIFASDEFKDNNRKKKTKHTIIISQSSLVLSDSDVKRNKATRIGICDSWSHG